MNDCGLSPRNHPMICPKLFLFTNMSLHSFINCVLHSLNSLTSVFRFSFRAFCASCNSLISSGIAQLSHHGFAFHNNQPFAFYIYHKLKLNISTLLPQSSTSTILGATNKQREEPCPSVTLSREGCMFENPMKQEVPHFEKTSKDLAA